MSPARLVEYSMDRNAPNGTQTPSLAPLVSDERSSMVCSVLRWAEQGHVWAGTNGRPCLVSVSHVSLVMITILGMTL